MLHLEKYDVRCSPQGNLRGRFVDRSTRSQNQDIHHDHHDASAPEGGHLLNHLKNPWPPWCNHDDSAPVGGHL